MASLLITNGDQADTYFRIANRPLTVGRDPARDIQLVDEKVSRKHFRVRKEGEGYVLTEFKSLNGVYVNGTKIEGEHVLQDGDQIQAGDTILAFYTTEELDKTDALNKYKLADRHLREDRTISK